MENTTWQGFLNYLQNRYTTTETNSILSSMAMLNTLGRKNGLLSTSIGLITDLDTVEAIHRDVGYPQKSGVHSKKALYAIKKALDIYKNYLIELGENEGQQAPTAIVDFTISKSYAHTKPIKYIYKGITTSASSWNTLFFTLVQHIYSDYKDVFPIGKSLSASSRIDTGAPDQMIKPRQIDKDLYLECNISASSVVSKIRSLMDICNISYGDIIITYVCTSNNSDQATNDRSKHIPTSLPKIAVDPELNTRIDKILRNHFEEGLILNALRLDKFRMIYNDEFGEELTKDDSELTAQLKACGTFIDGRVYPGADIKQNKQLDEIRVEILRILQCGAHCVYLSCVLKHWRQELTEGMNIYNEKVLGELLMKEHMPGVYATDSVLKMTPQSVDPADDVLQYMKSCHNPVTYAQLEEAIWFIPIDKIKTILVNTPGIVNVDLETYFYASNFPASPTELQQIKQVIKAELDRKGFLVAQDIKRLIYDNCTAVAINTSDYKDWAYRNIFSWLFREEFEFTGAIVSDKGNKLQMSQIYRSFCRDHETLTLDELKTFAHELGVVIYWDDVLNEMIRIDANTMLRKDKIHFDIERTDSVLESMIYGEYMPVQEINLFLHFPTIEVPWNLFVLECYLKNYSKSFRLLQVGVAQDKVCGIVTRANSGFEDYEHAVIDLLAHDYSWKNQNEALALIVDKGCQARKRWAGFDKIIQAAIQRRAEIEKRKM